MHTETIFGIIRGEDADANRGYICMNLVAHEENIFLPTIVYTMKMVHVLTYLLRYIDVCIISSILVIMTC